MSIGNHVKWSHVWNSNIYPQHSAFNVWRESLIAAPLRLSLDCDFKEDFKARLECVGVGSTVIAREQSTAYSATLSERDIAASSIDGFLLQSIVSGQIQLEAGKHARVFKPGDVWLADLQRPSKWQFGTGASWISLHIPRQQLETIAGSVECVDGFVHLPKRTALNSCLL